MNWQTLRRVPQADEFEPGGVRRSETVHIRVEGDTFSLCGKADVYDGLWAPGRDDEHPEDVDPLDQCTVCYSVQERRRCEERGREVVPSNRLGIHVRGRELATA